MLRPSDNEERYKLHSPTALPLASSFLWNAHMMIQVNCRGYAVAQFMQPEPAKYAHAPNLEAKTFMQPEQAYYAHHPGRFFYLKDENTGEFFSIPYEPVRAALDFFEFSPGKHDIQWLVRKAGWEAKLTLTLANDRPLELWQVEVKNLSDTPKTLSLYPYFPVGYMSWMNQSGRFHSDLNAIVCSSVTPYQKYPDYFKNKDLKDKTFLMSERAPDAWDCQQAVFEGEGGLHGPSGIRASQLANSDAIYETPTAVMQFRLNCAAQSNEVLQFAFGPARDEAEIACIQKQYFGGDNFPSAIKKYQAYVAQGKPCIEISTPDPALDNFVNHWLARQIFYHGDVNRLTTDPQTRNYLQDNMGLSYIRPKTARKAFLTALSQQSVSGAMPDGILIHPSAELKYINQVPHTDHCVWLPICLQVYLDETDDYAILDEPLPFADDDNTQSVAEHIHLAMQWLLKDRDARGLNYIAQGDWCDPMNMVGYKGRGVSGWLTVATAYALSTWADICDCQGLSDDAERFRQGRDACNTAMNTHLWDGAWYGRGITDDGVKFGVQTDCEGKIFLNPQAWSLLSGAASSQQRQLMIAAVEEHLKTPYGVAMLAPAFTAMREDVGRVTQKHPGSAENGSVYNHAAAFYIYALFATQESNKAYELLRMMIPGPDEADYIQRGQLPVFIPNYYRGAFHQFPRTAGRSSQLFNTGTVHWYLRCLIDGLFGLRGTREGLQVAPCFPEEWDRVKVTRHFRGACFQVTFQRKADITSQVIRLNGTTLQGNCISGIRSGEAYQVDVDLPQK